MNWKLEIIFNTTTVEYQITIIETLATPPSTSGTLPASSIEQRYQCPTKNRELIYQNKNANDKVWVMWLIICAVGLTTPSTWNVSGLARDLILRGRLLSAAAIPVQNTWAEHPRADEIYRATNKKVSNPSEAARDYYQLSRQSCGALCLTGLIHCRDNFIRVGRFVCTISSHKTAHWIICDMMYVVNDEQWSSHFVECEGLYIICLHATNISAIINPNTS